MLIFWPFERMVRMSLRTVVHDVPPQDIITRDNVSVKVNAVRLLPRHRSAKAIVEVENYLYATSQLAQTTLRSVLGQAELDELLVGAREAQLELQKIIDEHTEPWGIKVVARRGQAGRPAARDAARDGQQAEAEREKRAKIIHAEGELEASAQLSQAAEIIGRQPATLQLRYLQTLTEIANEKNSTIVFPLPIDLISTFLARKMGGGERDARGADSRGGARYTPPVEEPRTHYQISLTARQAVGLFAGLLLALGGAFFFGLMTGLSGRGTAPAPAAQSPAEGAETADGGRTAAATVAEAVPPVETGVPAPTSSSPSRTELSSNAVTPGPGPEPTAPATVQTFEDGVAEDAGAPAAATGAKAAPPATKAKAPGPAVRPPAPASGKIWVQAASLQSHDEANALSARLSKHGFHAVIVAASGPKGKVYRVRVGPYRTDDEAARTVSKLAKAEKIRDPWIVPEGK